MLSRSMKRGATSSFLDINSALLSTVIVYAIAKMIPGWLIVRDTLEVTLYLLLPSLLLCNMALGLYETKIRDSIRGVLRRGVLSVSISFVLIELLSLVLTAAGSLQTVVQSWATAPILLLTAVIQTIWRYWAFDKGGFWLTKRRILVIGAAERAEFLPKRMRRSADRKAFEIIGFFPLAHGVAERVQQFENVLDSRTDYPVQKTAHCLNATSEALLLHVEKEQPDLIALANGRKEHIPTKALLACKMSGIHVCEIEDFIEHELGQIAVEHLRDEWLLTAPGFSLGRPWFDAMHYLMNAGMALLMLVAVSPLMLLTALAIYLDDGKRDNATVLYRQIRTGRNGKPFNVLKFRSMGKHAEQHGAQWAVKDDVRVTRIGGFLRKYRLDELPQLLNILRGDMCFVGPRPERPVFVEQLAESIPFFHYRHSVKPGLTGWAQVNYPYGATVADSHEKLKYDLYYIKHRSIMLDLYILIRTVEVVLFGKGR